MFPERRLPIAGILLIIIFLCPATACRNNGISSDNPDTAKTSGTPTVDTPAPTAAVIAPETPAEQPPETPLSNPQPVAPATSYTYRIVRTYPHDIGAFTEGLVYQDGLLYESTGIEGQSSVRIVNLSTGKPINITNLPPEIFGEGIALFDGKIIQLSWKNQWAFIYDQKTLSQTSRFRYPMAEGWGITYDGEHLIMSDGSSTLYLLDKNDFSEIGRIRVRDSKGPVVNLNELEYIEGEIWANVWQTNDIVRINPSTGIITGRINLAGLLKPEDRHPGLDVLNGIAYDKERKRIFVTGKNWPKLFEIEVIKK